MIKPCVSNRFVSKAEVTDYVDKDQLPVSLGGNNEAAATNVMENDLTGGVDKKQVTFNASNPSPTAGKSVTDKMGILQISPADTLTFSVVQSNSESLPQAIKMTNIKETQVAYKVKTTAPEHYRVGSGACSGPRESEGERDVFLLIY
eukprot:sb/3473816/